MVILWSKKMNERFKELAEQALNDIAFARTLPDGQLERTWHPDRFNKRYAELIVKECCQALWTQECHTSDLAVEELKRNTTRIKEHFGVKE
jgi:hypothetical protein